MDADFKVTLTLPTYPSYPGQGHGDTRGFGGEQQHSGQEQHYGGEVKAEKGEKGEKDKKGGDNKKMMIGAAGGLVAGAVGGALIADALGEFHILFA